jgi:hypothetical protein
VAVAGGPAESSESPHPSRYALSPPPCASATSSGCHLYQHHRCRGRCRCCRRCRCCHLHDREPGRNRRRRRAEPRAVAITLNAKRTIVTATAVTTRVHCLRPLTRTLPAVTTVTTAVTSRWRGVAAAIAGVILAGPGQDLMMGFFRTCQYQSRKKFRNTFNMLKRVRGRKGKLVRFARRRGESDDVSLSS